MKTTVLPALVTLLFWVVLRSLSVAQEEHRKLELNKATEVTVDVTVIAEPCIRVIVDGQFSCVTQSEVHTKRNELRFGRDWQDWQDFYWLFRTYPAIF